ncbi:PPM-type phosphatase-like domain [Dillenia turbinata]|uniref:PPM-type phosphatase-like domain n=1 Tax=Dillenia turbinata TaxID=194707 RepID=A0AAN8W530_9MAGN
MNSKGIGNTLEVNNTKGFGSNLDSFRMLAIRIGLFELLPMKPQIASVGSSCLVEAIANDQLYVANLGNSRVVLGRKDSKGGKKNSVVARSLSTDHNVGVEEVRNEVKTLHLNGSHIVMYTRGVITSNSQFFLENLVHKICS